MSENIILAEYIQRGETLDYRNETSEIIPAGAVLTMGNHIGITGTEMLPGELGSIYVTGVFKIAKTGEAEIAIGTPLSFDGTSMAAAAENAKEVGYAAAPAAASDKEVLVKLCG